MNEQTPILDDLAAALDEYDFVAEIGRGGASTVYLARDRELDREVAIKVIGNGFLEDEEARARAEREARTLARLDHPNIVTLLGARRLPDGRIALVLQRAGGTTLRSVLESQGRFRAARAADVVRQLASALDYLHRRGIVHRDVKPENVFVEDDGRVLLSDLGIAKAIDVPVDVTLSGVIVGTPAYMSPEQIDGSPLDGRSDQYSLGLLAHELLTGQRPWAGENLYSVIFKQKNEPLPDLGELRPDVPVHLRELIARATAKDPAERWPSLEVLLERLEHRVPVPEVLRGIAVHGGPEATGPVEATSPTADRFARTRNDGAPRRTTARPGRVLTAILALGVVLAGSGTLAVARPASMERLVEILTPAPSETEAAPPPPVAEPAVAVDASSGGRPPEAGVEPPAEPRMEPAIAHPAEPAEPPPAATPDAPPLDVERTAAADAAPQLGAGGSGGTAAPDPPPLATAGPVAAGADAARTLEAEEAEEAAAERIRANQTLVALGGSIRPRIADSALRPAAPTATASIQGASTGAGRYVGPVLRNLAEVDAEIRARYPREVARLARGGTVGLWLRVDDGGRVTEARVAASSGHAELDALALAAAREMRFTPAEHRGVAVAADIRLPLLIRP